VGAAFSWIKPDRFTLTMMVTLALATFFPARDVVADVVQEAGLALVFLLFFLHGGNLSPRSILGSLGHWRFHTLVLAATYLLFPTIGLLFAPFGHMALDSSLYTGVLFLCCLPSTVQSSVAFTSMARGNIPAAVCAASVSNLLGVFITPLLVSLLLARHGAISFASAGPVFTTILLPFMLGQLARPWIGGWLAGRRRLLAFTDRGSILLMVYAAFGQAATRGLWGALDMQQLGILVLVCLVVLACALSFTLAGARLARLPEADRSAVALCGSMKSLVTGVPMAMILFPSETAAAIVLPLMIFHQIQLLVCAWLARSWGRKAEAGARPPLVVS